jgi:hypothetical protein
MTDGVRAGTRPAPTAATGEGKDSFTPRQTKKPSGGVYPRLVKSQASNPTKIQKSQVKNKNDKSKCKI